ncbi:DNA primase, partial [Enterobacter hormaechei]|nr:DNA primase [Enterobacter hormaechei]
MKTAEAAKGQWAMIFEHFGLPPINARNHFKGECPVCGARGKLRIDDRDGRGPWICTCGSGDGMKLVTLTQGKPFNEICREIDQLIGNNFTREAFPRTSDAVSARDRVLSKFSKLVNLKGTTGADYLQARGIYQLPQEAVKFNDKQRYGGKVYQCLYSLATD